MKVKKVTIAEVPVDNTQTVLLQRIEVYLKSDEGEPDITELAVGMAGKPYILVSISPTEMEWRSDPITELTLEEVAELPRRGVGKFQQAAMLAVLAGFGIGRATGQAEVTGRETPVAVRAEVRASQRPAPMVD